MFKVMITFYYSNKTTSSYFYYDINDLVKDLNYDLSMSVNSCVYYVITYLNYDFDYERGLIND